MSDFDGGVGLKNRPKHKEKGDEKFEEPKNYKVIFLNDSETPADFVVQILRDVFHKDAQAAEKIMTEAHTTGKCIAGVYTYDIALTKSNQSMDFAKNSGYPLQVVMEEE